MTIQEQRPAVIEEAATWLKTKYHHQGQVKNVGVDCVHLPAACYDKVLGMKFIMPPYGTQWHLHQTRREDGTLYFKEIYVEGLLNQGFIELSNNRPDFEPFDKDNFLDEPAQPGDLVVTKLARVFVHGAIIMTWPQVIQAESSPYGRGEVCIANANVNWFFTSRPLKFFSPKVWHK